MNKILHGLVYVFLALAAAALYFELDLNAKRDQLRDRNRMQEDYLVRIAKTIEKTEPAKVAPLELKRDASPVEAKLVDTPDTENVLEEYNAHLEQSNLETFSWDSMATRDQLREVYVTDGDGNPLMDGSEKLQRGSPEDKLLESLFEAAKSQQSRLNSTRAELMSLRGKLESVVAEINKLKPEARQDKVAVQEKQEKIEKLEAEKAELEGQIDKIKSQIDELNTEITSLKDEARTAKEETEAVKEDLAKSQKLVDQLKKLLMEQVQQGNSTVRGTSVTSLSAGDKGKIIECDNENMFAVVKLDDGALKELKGEHLDQPLPLIELSVKRAGHQGEAGEFVGRVRLRQEIKGKPYVICDILAAWELDKLQINDTVFSD